MNLHRALLRPSLCLIPLLTAAVAEPGTDTWPLEHEAHRHWDFDLPAERWRLLEGGLELPGGLFFAVDVSEPGRLRMDTDADGTLDQSLRGESGLLHLRARTPDEQLVRYSLRIRALGHGRWEWSTASSRSGMVAGEQMHVIDQDGNGRYDDYGVDALVMGYSRRACLLSRVVVLGGSLRRLEITPDGDLVRVWPFEGDTGLLDVSTEHDSEGELTSAVFRSGQLSFDLARHPGGLEVPVGSYVLVRGLVEYGPDRVVLHAGSMKPLVATKDTLLQLSWGAPLSGVFAFGRRGTQVVIGPGLHVFGRAGEEIEVPRTGDDLPRVIVLDAQSGRRIVRGRLTRASGEAAGPGGPTTSLGGFLPFVASVPEDVTATASVALDIPLFGRVELVPATEVLPKQVPEPDSDPGEGDGLQ